jgi:phosphoribosylanthranilate isomerase
VSAVLPVRADRSPLIKMCGMRRSSDIRAAAEAGADLIGMVFAPSRRRVSPDEARAVLDEVGPHPPLVGVFVDETANLMNETARVLGLSFIQLSGDEEPNVAADLDTPYFKVVHLRAGDTADQALRRMADWSGARAFLLDAWSPRGGGSGQTTDWVVAAEVIAHSSIPVFLAGGLHSDNVREAVRQTAPFGVDVSSGIEKDGWKDSVRIEAFARAVRKGRES